MSIEQKAQKCRKDVRKMLLSESQLRRIIREALDRSNEEYHCHNGDIVLFGSSQCIEDIELRILDVVRMRNQTKPMSDKRVHCNGYLKMLRRELAAAQRVSASNPEILSQK
jgi:hypothetical protein